MYLVEIDVSFERLVGQVGEFVSTWFVHVRYYFSSADSLNVELMERAHYLDSMVF